MQKCIIVNFTTNNLLFVYIRRFLLRLYFCLHIFYRMFHKLEASDLKVLENAYLHYISEEKLFATHFANVKYNVDLKMFSCVLKSFACEHTVMFS